MMNSQAGYGLNIWILQNTMADTGIHGPTANQAISGVTQFSQPQRVHENVSGASASGFNNVRGQIWKGIFSSEIPNGATVNGFEVISTIYNSSKGNIGNFGASGSTESTSMEIYLWNGSSLSSALTLENRQSGSGIVYTNSNTTVTFTGSNKRHPSAAPFGTYGDGRVMAGSPTSLGGLSFTVSDQADWGFAIKCTAIVNTPVYGVIRGIGLKCYYTGAASGYGNDVNDVSSSSIVKINDIATADIVKINDV